MEPQSFTKGQTEPIRMTLMSSGEGADLTGATVQLVLVDAGSDGALWAFGDDEADVTLDTAEDGEISWVPADGGLFNSKNFYGQFKVEWGNGEISFIPRDFKQWPWKVLDPASET